MRYGTATRVALCGLFASGIVGAGLFACNDVIKDQPLTLSEREAGGGGGSSGNGPEAPSTCNVEKCCNIDPKCFVSGKEGPGAECLATRDNTGKNKIQLRQTWVYPTSPAGLRIDEIYGVLNQSTALPMCNTPTGAAGYVRVMETDLDNEISRVGWATYVGPSEVDDALTNGLCMIQSPAGSQGWIDTATLPDGKPRALRQDQIYRNDNYPPGLPQPAAQPWLIRPTQAARVTDNFELERDGEGGTISATNKGKLTEAGQAKRRELLAKTLEQKYVDAGISGFYYMDETAGTVHGYATIAYQIIYNIGKLGESYIVVPIHEPETFQKYTNAQQRNCVGVYRAGQVDQVDCAGLGKAQDPAMAAWSGVDTTKIGVGDAWTKGYFLIAELEQIYVDLLSQTLCFSYPGREADMSEWGTDTIKTCRATGKWDATKPDTNMPRGDWCSETNGPADENCADAWLTVAYHGFAAANIREGTCDP